jgi:predicted Zn-dependent protease
MERWDMAVEIAKALMAAEPDSPRRATCLARVTRRAQSLEAAIAVLQAAIERRTSNNQVYYDLACYTCLKGDMVEALAYLEQAIKLDPGLRLVSLEDEDLTQLWMELGKK